MTTINRKFGDKIRKINLEKETRPFNLEHAKAGAPFCCANGEHVDVLKWDRKHTLQIIGLARQDQAIRTWRVDGTYTDPHSNAYLLVMLPIGYVEGKPVFVGDELVTPSGMLWTATPTCSSEPGRTLADCSWPKPEPVYPQSDLNVNDIKEPIAKAGILVKIFVDDTPDSKRNFGDYPAEFALRLIGSAALRKAIDNGQVVRAEDVNTQVIDNVIKSGGRNLVPEELLGKVAEAVLKAVGAAAMRQYAACIAGQVTDADATVLGHIDTAAIVADVKAGKA